MVDTQPFLPSSSENIILPVSYSPLHDGTQPDRRRRPTKGLVAVVCGLCMVALMAAIIGSKIDRQQVLRHHHHDRDITNGTLSSSSSSTKTTLRETPATTTEKPLSRGVSAGVSEKTNRLVGAAGGNSPAFPWNNSMLSWQRTAFHFQPEKNWMNGTFSFFLLLLLFFPAPAPPFSPFLSKYSPFLFIHVL